MRLIDADALDFEDIEEEHGSRNSAVVACEILIDNAPTIEAEPVRHGKWHVEPGIGRKCSVCDFDIGNDLDYMDYVNYCPSCGARMDKEVEE